MAQLLQLPPELLTEILATISLSDLLSASVTCKRFYQLIHASIPLQYRLALLSTGHTDNLSSQCALVTADRVFCLREMEKAWRVAHVARVVRIPAPPEGPSGIYDLTGGVYFLGERGGTRTQAMRWVRLPSKDDPEDVEAPVWQRAEVGEDIVDIGVNVRELDLLAVVTECVLYIMSLTLLLTHPCTFCSQKN